MRHYLYRWPLRQTALPRRNGGLGGGGEGEYRAGAQKTGAGRRQGEVNVLQPKVDPVPEVLCKRLAPGPSRSGSLCGERGAGLPSFRSGVSSAC